MQEDRAINDELAHIENTLTTVLEGPQLQNKIVRDGDQHYLLPRNKKLHELSSESRLKAVLAYQQLKPAQINKIKNDQTRQEIYNDRKQVLVMQKEQLKKDIVQITNHIADINSLRSEIENADQQTTTTPSLKLVPRSTSNPARLQPTTQQRIARAYGCLLAQKNKLSPTGLNGLRSWAKNNAPTLREDLGKIRPGVPIPIDIMKIVLRRMMNHGISVASNKTTSQNQMHARFNLRPKLK